MNLIVYLFKQSPGPMALATAMSILAGLSGTALVAVIGVAVTSVDGRRAMLAPFLALCVAYVLAKSISDNVLLRVTQNRVCELRISLAQRILATSQKRLQALGKDELLVILTKDIDTFIQAFQALPMAMSACVLVAGPLIYMAWDSWRVFAVLTVSLALSVVAFVAASRRPARQLAELREETGALHGEFRNLVLGSRELQLDSRRADYFVREVLGKRTARYRELIIQCMSRYAWILNAGNMMFYQGLGLVLFVIPRFSSQDPKVLVNATLILLYLIRPVSELIMSMPVLRGATVALGKIEQLRVDLEQAPATLLAQDPFTGTAPWLLELAGVQYGYSDGHDDHFVFGPIDLQVRQGEILFIIGGNGSGKTTLGLLLLGLNIPDKGSVVFRSVRVTDANRNNYRQHFCAVFADFHLFDFPLEDVDSDTVAEANVYLEKFGLGHKVRADGSLSGNHLSTGQRKRLALVSAYLDDKPVYLFDEWAADQDPVFKRVFYTEVLPELKSRGKTVIIISHDDAYFAHADRIVKLESGLLKARGAAASPA